MKLKTFIIIDAIVMAAIVVILAMHFSSDDSSRSGQPAAGTVAGLGKLRTGPMVQLLQPDGFTVVWTMTGDEPMAIRVGRPRDPGGVELDVTPTNGRYVATITGLKSGAVYHYEITPQGSGNMREVIASGQARTDPGPDGSFRFIAFGDTGTGEADQFALAEVISRYHVALLVHTGDVIYYEGAAEDYPAKFFEPYEEILTRSAFYPVAGNHDIITERGQPLFDVFELPADRGPEGATPERHYWFDYGGVRFVGFDSDEPFSVIRDQVAPWMDDVLSDAGDRWKVVFCHHPMYTHGKYDPSGKLIECIEPLLDKHLVDLVLVGHNHMYERSHPVHERQIVKPARGTVHVTTAAGGATIYDINSDPVPETIAVQNNSTFSFTHVEVTPEEMVIQQISLNDEPLDEFVIPRKQAVASQPVAAAQ